MTKKLWFDVTNSSHVHFFQPLIEEFKDQDILVSSRDLAETNELLEKLGLDYRTLGGYWGKMKFMKVLGHLVRGFRLLPYVRSYDYSFSHGSVSPIMVRKLLGGELIASYDNEHADSFDLLAKHSDHFIVPEVLEKDAKKKAGKGTKVYTYPGVKEQIYLADFKPDKEEISEVPFDDYVVLRPEAWKSHYLGDDGVLAFDLAKRLMEEDHNIVLLPRYGEVPNWVRDEEQIYIPEETLDGPQLCWFSEGVLTGSGTLAREAAVLGVPAVSFYPGERLKVSEWLEDISSLRKIHSISEIIKFFDKKIGAKNTRSNNKKVKNDFLNLIFKVVN